MTDERHDDLVGSPQQPERHHPPVGAEVPRAERGPLCGEVPGPVAAYSARARIDRRALLAVVGRRRGRRKPGDAQSSELGPHGARQPANSHKGEEDTETDLKAPLCSRVKPSLLVELFPGALAGGGRSSTASRRQLVALTGARAEKDQWSGLPASPIGEPGCGWLRTDLIMRPHRRRGWSVKVGQVGGKG